MGKQHDLYDEGLFDRVKDYVGTSVELVKLNAIDKSATVISALVASLILAVVGFFFIFFLSVSVGLFLGLLMSSFTFIKGFHLLKKK